MSFLKIDKPRPQVTQITLNRPERKNSMAFDVMIPLRDALREASLDTETRVVVLTGAGDAFCSGADLENSGVVRTSPVSRCRRSRAARCGSWRTSSSRFATCITR